MSQWRYILTIGALCFLAAEGCDRSIPINQNSHSDVTISDLKYHITYLASDDLQGREAGSEGEKKAGAYIAGLFERFGLEPAGKNGSYFHTFEVVAGVEAGKNNRLHLTIGGEEIIAKSGTDFLPLAFTENGQVEGPLVFAGYGIQAPNLHYDDFTGIDVRDKIVLVLRYAPDGDNPHGEFYSHAALRHKAAVARDKGAKAVLFVTGEKNDPEDQLVPLKLDGSAARSGIVAASLSRKLAGKLFASAGTSLDAIQSQIDSLKQPVSFAFTDVQVQIETDVRDDRRAARNVAGLLRGSDPERNRELIIVGAHYDHLGLGGSSSLDRSGTPQIHNGADDNASGTAALLELAEKLASEKQQWRRSVLFIAFSAEEMGLLGSTAYVKEHVVPLDHAVAMLNMDMIGRLRDDKLIVYGASTAPTWDSLLDSLNALAGFGFALKKSRDGTGPSDHSTFYQANIPVLALFTDVHSDYHTPGDDAEKINYEGEVRIVRFAYALLKAIDALDARPRFTKVESTERRSMRRGFRVYVGTIPDYSETDVDGLKISGVSAGSPAERVGLQAGDIIVRFGGREIKNIYDYTYALQDLQPGQEVDIVVRRHHQLRSFHMRLERRR